MNRKLIVIAGAATLLLFAAFALRLVPHGDDPDAAQTAAGALSVEVSRVERSTMTQVVTAVGIAEAVMDVTVESETAGRIRGVHFNTGDLVAKGQVLVTVDDELKAVAVDQAKAGALAAETQAKKAARDLERAGALHASQDVSDAELEAYRLAARAAEAQHRSALAALRAAERALADTRIASPIAGSVASRLVETGEMVRPGKAVADIVDLRRVKVRLSVPEHDIVKLRAGQKASVELDARPGERFSGKVLNIGSKAESPTGHTYPVEVLVEDGGARGIKSGMFARAEIVAAAIADAITIPKDWLAGDDARPVVFVARGDTAREVRVKLGGTTAGNAVQVLEGLDDGDLVVTFGQKELADGAPIRYRR
jgi:RND family efflux transporter MFP subunit